MKYTFTFLIILFVVVVSIFTILINSIGFNALSESLEEKKIVFTLSPQGWAFFTRSPKEAQLLLYKIEDSKIKDLHHKHSHYSNYFGLSRSCTKTFSELQLIKSKIQDSLYVDIKFNYLLSDPIKQLELDKINSVTVKNQFKMAYLNGKYIFIIQDILPWAWLSSRNKLYMNAKAIIIEIT